MISNSNLEFCATLWKHEKLTKNFKGIFHIGVCATDGDCRYKEKTNSDLKTKCDKSVAGTSYSTRGPDFTASTATNPYSSKTLYKCGCQDNYVQKSDNWRQEGCGKYGIPGNTLRVT